MRWVGIAAVLVIAACSGGGPHAGASPSAAGTASASATATASPATLPSPTPAALPCRMPASLRIDQGGMRMVLGWLSLPSGTTTDDPVNHIIVTGNFPTGNGGTQPIWATDHSPQLYGYSLATYSAAAGGWLPAPPELVSADGLHYAYLHPDGTIRLADSTGGEAIVPNPSKLTPLAYAPFGVVLTSNDIVSNGLWLLDPGTHAITIITPPAGNDNWLAVSGTGGRKTLAGTLGIAWGEDSPGVLGYPPATKVLYEYIGLSAQPGIAYTAPAGDAIELMEVDAGGSVLVALTGSAPGLVYIAASGVANQVALPPGVSVTMLSQRHHADAHGTWFVGPAGIFLFTPGSALQKIAPGPPTDVVPAGDCA